MNTTNPADHVGILKTLRATARDGSQTRAALDAAIAALESAGVGQGEAVAEVYVSGGYATLRWLSRITPDIPTGTKLYAAPPVAGEARVLHCPQCPTSVETEVSGILPCPRCDTLMKIDETAKPSSAKQPSQVAGSVTEDDIWSIECAVENMRSADATPEKIDARFRLASKLSKIAAKLRATPADATAPMLNDRQLDAVRAALARAEYDAGDFSDDDEDEANARSLYEGLTKLLHIADMLAARQEKGNG